MKRRWRELQRMQTEQHTVFLDWSELCCENGHTAKGDLHTQHSPNQIVNAFFRDANDSSTFVILS